MNLPTYLRPLVVKLNGASVKVGEISLCCGSVRVQGWIDAPSKDEGFDASRGLGSYLGRRSVGGYCDEQDPAKAVSFPFSFDLQLELVAPHYRRENYDEAIRRVFLSLRRARTHFSTRP